jgi:hypothetical protein
MGVKSGRKRNGIRASRARLLANAEIDHDVFDHSGKVLQSQPAVDFINIDPAIMPYATRGVAVV